MKQRPTKRQQLRERIVELERELSRTQTELVASSVGDKLPGLYLLVRFGERRALLPSYGVLEIVPLVAQDAALRPAPGVLGGFVYRGQAKIAVGLASLFGAASRPPLEAHVLILAGIHHVALVVDRVETLWEAPWVVEGSQAADLVHPNGAMIAGHARQQELTLPLLSLDAIIQASVGAG
ncbi:MAG: chemotaxis protein CheW [Myxococcaceae bacterium]